MKTILRAKRFWIGGLALAVILAVSGGIMAVGTMDHMAAPVTCIFMPGEEAVCPMTALEHLAHWQTMMAGTFAGYLVLCTFGVVVLYLIRRTHAPPRGMMHARRWPQAYLDVRLRSRLFLYTSIAPRAP